MACRHRSKLTVSVGSMAASVLLSGCHVPGFAVPHPADKQGQLAARLWNDTEFVALAVGILVWGLIAYVVVRYRRRRRAPADVVPSQHANNVPLEVVYTAVPVLIVVALFVFTTAAQRKINAVSTHPDVRVEATAFQWGWRFHYPAGNVTTVSQADTPPELVLPLGQVTEVDLVATDVVHAFYVPAFLFQRAAVPGSPTRFDLTPTMLGSFSGQCSTFCGLRHYAMLFTVRIVSPSQFDQWMASQPKDPAP